MFFKRSTGKVVLVADIDDMSVGVSVARLSRDTTATIITSDRMTLPIEDRAKEHSAAAILQLLEQCTEKVLKIHMADSKAARPPRAAYAILRSPWTRFRTAHTEEGYEKPRAVTKELLATLAKKALEAPSELDSANILETGVMQVYLNGYPTGQPIGKRVTLASVVAFESDVQPDMQRGVAGVLGKLLPGRTIVVRSSMSALLTVLAEHLPNLHRFLVLDVGSRATYSAVVLKESMLLSTLIPEGMATILGRVSSGGLPEETLTQLRMLATDTCSTDACKALKDSLARAEPDLAKVFGEGFASLAAKRRLPNAAILLAPDELSPWLQSFFSRIDFSQFTATMQPLTIESLSADHMHDIALWNVGIRSDAGVGIAAGYVNILEQAS